MVDDDLKGAAKVMQRMVELLTDLSEEDRGRVLSAVIGFFGSSESPIMSPVGSRGSQLGGTESGTSRVAFSADTDMSPKEFLLDKQPRSDVERVACLAYYLTHYRDSPHFLTLDISKLNTEAAQPKFSNTAVAMKNAVAQHYLVSAGKSKMRQLSAGGEQFVRLLPDRKTARDAMQQARPRRRAKKKASKRRT